MVTHYPQTKKLHLHCILKTASDGSPVHLRSKEWSRCRVWRSTEKKCRTFQVRLPVTSVVILWQEQLEILRVLISNAIYDEGLEEVNCSLSWKQHSVWRSCSLEKLLNFTNGSHLRVIVFHVSLKILEIIHVCSKVIKMNLPKMEFMRK